MSVSVGSKAPDFTLKSANYPGGEKDDFGLATVSLSDFRGKSNVVLLFFPGVFTLPCTKEMCTVTDMGSDMEVMGATVLGISVDSALAQKVWVDKEGIGIPLLSDFNKKTVGSYGVTVEDFLGLGSSSQRAAFVIDREGVVQYAEVTPTLPEQPDFEAIRTIVAQLK